MINKRKTVAALLLCGTLVFAFATGAAKVYVTETGKKYHLKNCQTIKDSQDNGTYYLAGERTGLHAMQKM